MKRHLGLVVVVFSCLLFGPAAEAGGPQTRRHPEGGARDLFLSAGNRPRCSCAIRGDSVRPEGKFVLAGLVDTSGYASDLQAKYQGFLITEVKLDIEGKELQPGQYGFGFSADGTFLVMDVGANDLFSVAGKTDAKLAHPVPLKVVEDGGAYRLYAGRKWVNLKAE